MAGSLVENPSSATLSPSARADALLELASLHYGVRPGTDQFSSGYVDGPARRRQALELVEAHPETAHHGIHTAALCGDLEHVRRLLAADPSLASRPGGKEGWPPLLFVCYGRLPTAAAAENAPAIARALLDCGADPNAHWILRWEAVALPWSAVCGAIGYGEAGPVRVPPHPRAAELVALLLERGAGANQGQALYNTMLRQDEDRWLGLFIERGLGAQDLPVWAGPAPTPTLFDILLRQAALKNQVRRATLLLRAGAHPQPAGGDDLYGLAMARGNVEVAELLHRHGAVAGPGDERRAFVLACHRRDLGAARALLDEHPPLLELAADLLIDTAAARDLVDLAALLLDLGVSPDAEKREGRYRALHHAATMNSANVAQFLLERGAEVDARDGIHQATPLVWAVRPQALAAVEVLGARSRDIFSVVVGGLEARLRELLRDPTLANATLDEAVGLGVLSGQPGETPLFALPEDERQAVAVAEVLLRAGADPARRNRDGLSPADKARARGLHAAADLLSATT